MDAIESAVRAAIDHEVKRISEEEAIEAGKRTEKRVRESAAAISVRLLKVIQISSFGDHLTIKLDTKDLKL